MSLPIYVVFFSGVRGVQFACEQCEGIYCIELSFAWSILRKTCLVPCKKKVYYYTWRNKYINKFDRVLHFLSHCAFELDTSALLDDDNDDHNVEEDEEDPGRLVSDGSEAAAEKWEKVKEAALRR